MYILKIIPIAKGLPENYFSYFSKEKYSLGTLVEIKIKNRKLFGLVCEINNIEKEKINLKSQNFALKKIERVVKENFISEELFQSILESSLLLGVRESEIIENYLPDWIYDNPEHKIFKQKKKLENNKETDLKSEKKEKERQTEYLVLDFENRNKIYFEKIKKNFANKKSTLIFFPTINDLEFSKKYFEKLFEEESGGENLNAGKILSFHSRQTKKELKDGLKKIEYGEEFLILSSSSLFPFLIKDKIDLETIILEKENSYNYFTHTAKKQIDAREMIKKVAKDLDLDLVLGGNMISLESYKEILPDFQSFSNSKDFVEKIFKIVDLTKEKRLEKEELETRVKKISEKKDDKYNSVYFSKELIEKLEEIKKNKGKVFLYAKRKGLYTETICADCNTIFKCKNCDKPYILYKNKNEKTLKSKNENIERIYICSNCKEKKELQKSEDLTCENCGSWRMNTLGIGTQGIEENLKEIGFKTFILDRDSVKTKKEIEDILNSWQKEETSILIGTDLALNFLNKDFEIDLAAIISLDSLFSISEINIDEKIFNICLEMREKISVKEKIIIQTRLIEQSVWKYIKAEDMIGFLENELETRKMLSLPPFSNILKFKLEKKEIKMRENIEKIFEKIWEEEKNIAHSNFFIQNQNTAHPQPLPKGKGLTSGYRTANTKNYKSLQVQSLDLRKNQTLAEEILWKELKGNKLGEHFRRQHIISGFIVDFICLKKNLVIEVDGKIHDNQKERDEEREKILSAFNLKIIRFTNEEILENLDKALQTIKSHLDLSEGKVLPLGKDIGWAPKPTISWRLEKKTDAYIGILTISKNLWQEKILEDNIEKIIPTNLAKKINTLLSDFKLEINPQSIY